MCCPACHCPIGPDEVQRYQTSSGMAFWQCPNCDACFPLAAEPAPKPVEEVQLDHTEADWDELAV